MPQKRSFGVRIQNNELTRETTPKTVDPLFSEHDIENKENFTEAELNAATGEAESLSLELETSYAEDYLAPPPRKRAPRKSLEQLYERSKSLPPAQSLDKRGSIYPVVARKEKEPSSYLVLWTAAENSPNFNFGQHFEEHIPDDARVRFNPPVAPATPSHSSSDPVIQTEGKTRYRPTNFHFTAPYGSGTLLKKETPAKEQERRRLSLERTVTDERIAQVLSTKIKEDFFEFTVSPEVINSRKGEKRPITQKRAFDNVTAAEVFRAFGVEIPKEKARLYHLAHRHGFLLGGDQKKDNLDVSTAGSNYETLFYVESTMQLLIDKFGIEQIQVRGDLEYHDELEDSNLNIVTEITYTFTFLYQGVELSFSKKIEPLLERRPTLSELEISNIIAVAFTKASASSAKTTPTDPLASSSTTAFGHESYLEQDSLETTTQETELDDDDEVENPYFYSFSFWQKNSSPTAPSTKLRLDQNKEDNDDEESDEHDEWLCHKK